MREIITSTGASLFTDAVLVAQTLMGGAVPVVPAHAATTPVVAAR